MRRLRPAVLDLSRAALVPGALASVLLAPALAPSSAAAVPDGPAPTAAAPAATAVAPTATAAAPTAPIAAPAVAAPSTVALSAPVFTSGLAQPTGVTSPRDGTGRLFVIEKAGRVVTVRRDGTKATYLDLRGRVSTAGERGLLGIAFNPAWKTNPFVYVAYTGFVGALKVVRYKPYANSSAAGALNPATATQLMSVPHSPSASNHNAGHLGFGTDGLLYISTGDGGNTPQLAQNVTSLSGKVLRVDPRRSANGNNYAIPPANPFARGGGRPEIWLWGLRNPWQFSVDRANGDLWIADVGQNRVEEITRRNQASPGGNLGWDCYEGKSVYNASRCFRGVPYVMPTITYGRSDGESVTGGYVYRGAAFPKLSGLYVYADFVSGKTWLHNPAGPAGNRTFKGPLLPMVTGFGEGDLGELYAVTIRGELRQIQGR